MAKKKPRRRAPGPGRKPRAGTRADRRLNIRLTELEFNAIERAAWANNWTLTDCLRMGAMATIAALDEGKLAIVGGRQIVWVERPIRADILPPPGRIKPRGTKKPTR